MSEKISMTRRLRLEANGLGEFQTYASRDYRRMLLDAADEIERLRKERDEARKMYCKEVEHHHDTTWNDGERDFKPLPALDVAKQNGWDCFKEDGK
jgi:hypothetical protein